MNLDESFWLAVSFVIFIYFAYRPVKKAILNSLDAKITEVKNLVSEAENLKKDAASLLLQTQNEIENLGSLRDQMLKDAKSEANIIAQSRADEMQLILDQKKRDTIASINQQQVKTYDNIKQSFAHLTTKLVEEYLKETSNNNLSDLEIAENLMHKGK